MFFLIGIYNNILNHLVRLLPTGEAIIGIFFSFSSASVRYPYACHRSLGLLFMKGGHEMFI